MMSHGPRVVLSRHARVRLVAFATAAAFPLLTLTPTHATEASLRSQSAPDPQPGAGPDEITEAASGKVRISLERATGRVGFARAARGGDLFPDSQAKPVGKATAYLEQYGDVFGAPSDQLVQTATRSDDFGTTVTFTQRYLGVPVFGSQLNLNFDAAGNLIAVNGFAAPDLALSVEPALSRAQAARLAIAAIQSDPPQSTVPDGSRTDAPAELQAAERELVIYRQGSLRGVHGDSLLAWRVLVSDHRDVSEQVFISASSGKVVNRYSTMPELIDRQLINGSSVVWNEGDSLPGSLTSEQQRIVNATGDTYWFFKNSFSRDSYDENGARMISVLNPPGLVCPGANWDGSRTNFCTGVTADDVVAHEWSHAYTDRSSDLVYQFQSGALNEAYSDIWGETIDLINARDDGEEGNLTAPRPMGGCSAHTRVQPVLTISAPLDLARDCLATAALFGPSLTATGVTGGIVAGVDADEDGIGTVGTNQDGCSTFTNPGTVSGQIALVDRSGGCTPATKATNAQAAGAIALVIANNNDTLQQLTGNAPAITIPTVLIGRANATAIRTRLFTSNPVSGTLRDPAGLRSNSYRWLLGEDVTNPGGAARDLWTPTCLGDPGKVSDAEYYCASTDNGGVHHNSGIPGHAYALLVDGGTYNGVQVTGLGLDKAAAIHYRAQTAILTPTSDFNDHADALSFACSSLVGLPNSIRVLTTSPTATPTTTASITAGDCNSVTAVIAATQLRSPPTQCGVMLDPNAPNPCGDGYSRLNLFDENFSDGLTGWTQLNEGRVVGGTGYPWLSISNNPATAAGKHSGLVAYARDLNVGNCSSGSGDVTSRDALISPPILLGTTALTNPRLTFDHYVATEDGVDGGNVKVKLNNGPWMVVPKTAYIFNTPTKQLTDIDNSNPLAGQEAFTGSNGGLATGSWGQSQIDLTFLGASSGDQVQIMFDFGRDGCFGIADGGGWYVDNVAFSVCRAKVSLATSQATKPSTYGQPARIAIGVSRDGTVGSVPNGTVTLRTSTGSAMGSAALVSGKASLSLPPSLSVGNHSLTATYAGTSVFEVRTATLVVSVAKTPSQAVAKPTPKKPRFRANFLVAVTISADVPVLGIVKIFNGSKLLGKAAVHDGLATIKIRKNLKPGAHKLRSLYVGSNSVDTSQDSFRVRVR